MKQFSYHILGTGSQANAYLFSDGDTTILIDAGFSAKQLTLRLEKIGYSPSDIDYIFLTHGHQDHTHGAPKLSNDYQIPLYTHPQTLVKGKECHYRKPFEPGDLSPSTKFNIQAFKTTHDAPGSMGYFLEMHGTTVLLLTDTGKTDEKMLAFAQKSDIIMIEANYCPLLLRDGPYAQKLKKRILSDWGHLSNEDSVSFINSVLAKSDSPLKKIYFCHLSATNNSLDALQSVIDEIYLGNVPYHICPRGEQILK